MEVHEELASFFDSAGFELGRFTRFWQVLVQSAARAIDDPDVLRALGSVPEEPTFPAAELSPEAAYQRGLVEGLLGLAAEVARSPATDAARSEMANPVAQLIMARLVEDGPMHGLKIAKAIERDPGQVQRVLQRMEERSVLQHTVEGRRKVFSPTTVGRTAWKDAQVRDGDW